MSDDKPPEIYHADAPPFWSLENWKQGCGGCLGVLPILALAVVIMLGSQFAGAFLMKACGYDGAGGGGNSDDLDAEPYRGWRD